MKFSPDQTVLRVAGAAPDGGELTISLDPTLAPPALSQRYFHQYQRQQRGAKVVAARLEQTRLRQRAIAEALALLDSAQSVAAVRRIAQEAQEEGLIPATDRPPPQRPDNQARGFDRHVIGGVEVLVGQSRRGNDQVTFREARPHDLWLHARGVPGAHVVIRASGPSVPDHVLQAAAALAARASAARHAATVAVDYTQRRSRAPYQRSPTAKASTSPTAKNAPLPRLPPPTLHVGRTQRDHSGASA